MKAACEMFQHESLADDWYPYLEAPAANLLFPTSAVLNSNTFVPTH